MRKKVRTISPDWKFSQIIKFFTKHKISGAPVVNKKGRVIGIISEKDLLFKLFPSEEDFYKNIEYYFGKVATDEELKAVSNLNALKVMEKNVISVGPDDHVLSACAMLLIHHIRRLPVIDKGKLVGIVTTNDVFRNYLLHASKGIH